MIEGRRKKEGREAGSKGGNGERKKRERINEDRKK
jgi:hypothetical protein